jgi:hypothetical protein
MGEQHKTKLISLYESLSRRNLRRVQLTDIAGSFSTSILSRDFSLQAEINCLGCIVQ